jgi:hypothetical protein
MIFALSLDGSIIGRFSLFYNIHQTPDDKIFIIKGKMNKFVPCISPGAAVH